MGNSNSKIYHPLLHSSNIIVYLFICTTPLWKTKFMLEIFYEENVTMSHWWGRNIFIGKNNNLWLTDRDGSQINDTLVRSLVPQGYAAVCLTDLILHVFPLLLLQFSVRDRVKDYVLTSEVFRVVRLQTCRRVRGTAGATCDLVGTVVVDDRRTVHGPVGPEVGLPLLLKLLQLLAILLLYLPLCI